MSLGKIFLGGGGDIEQSNAFDRLYFGLHQPEDTVLYIPIALGESNVASCINWFTELTSKHVKNRGLRFETLSRNSVIPDLSTYRSIYIGGGNTYELLEFIHSTGLDKELHAFLESDGIVYGGSAGAIILGLDIRTAEEENINNSSVHAGLNLLANHSIACHYSSDSDEKLQNIQKNLSNPIIAIPEEGGLLFNRENSEITLVGKVTKFDSNGKDLVKNDYKLTC